MSGNERQNAFTEILREVKKIIKTSPDGLDRDEIIGYFGDMELTDGQKDMVFEYLLKAQTEDAEELSEAADGEAENGEAEADDDDADSAPHGKAAADGEAAKPSKALEFYLEDIKNVREYTVEEKERLYLELLEGKNEAVEKLCESMLRETAILADRYASERVGLEDLIQEANLGIFVRLSELCGMGADCGYDVEEELSEAADSAMRAYASEMTGEADRESTVVGKLNLVNEAAKALRAQNGREPSPEELAEYTGLSGQELADIASLYNPPSGA